MECRPKLIALIILNVIFLIYLIAFIKPKWVLRKYCAKADGEIPLIAPIKII